MWALLNSDNTINKIITRPTALSIGDTNYPINIFDVWSRAELEVIGIVPVKDDNTNLKDMNYYTNTDRTNAVRVNETLNGILYARVVVSSYGTATAHTLADLKTEHKANINSRSAGALQSTDWMVIRAAEGGTAVPSATTTWRAAVRTKANSMQAQIDGAANVDALVALYVYNDATPQVRPLGEFPVLGT